MTLLPIVERELRVAARKSSTFWLRIAAALVAVVVSGGIYALSQIRMFGMGMGGSIGRTMFAVVTWISLAAALAAGLFFTADSLSEEKRE
ncbi:MAG TPA: ABC transporter permease, partial [Patescibacteria group bacterium]|nr:ABC transporter permease [Patescibacteria group bacterium]